MNRIINMYFATHKTCNLRCKYCYVPDHYKDSKKVEDSEILNSFYAFIRKTKEEGYRIGNFCLHGSEPSLMQPETIAEIASEMKKYYLSNKMINYRCAIQSNGVRFDRGYLSVLSNNIDDNKKIKLGFSIDPPKQVHDFLRNDSYDIVLDNLNLALEMGYPVSVLSVVSQMTMKHLLGFKDWMKHYLDLKARYNNPYKIKIKFATGEMALNEKQMEDFAYFLSDNDMLEIVQMLTPGYCIQNGNECNWYEFDIWGNCYSCNKAYNEEGIFANWKKESFENISIKRKNLYINDFENPECYECPYQFLCESGCPIDRHKIGEMKGKAHECTLIKVAYNELEKKEIHITDFYNNNI
jgi:radical SAM protein with 4Fe4S-binding SPASM domain